MSITSAFANAVSGLNASARKADVVSQNVANALTEGYARRELALSSRNLGGNGAGVSIDGVNRVYSRTVLAERRLSDAAAGNAALRQGFFSGLEAAIGSTGEQGSLTSEIDGLEAALIEATSRPDSSARLQATLDAAQGVASKLNSLSDSVQQARMNADSEIATQVSTLNTALGDIDKLNGQILVQLNSGHDATALMDQRQVLVDRVAAIVPLREVPRENAQIALYTVGGAILLDGNPAEIGFSISGVITADMTQASGALSGLTINGMAVRSTEDGLFGGGTLGALFAVRDELAVGAQDQLDAIARDLIERFEGSSVDPTLASGDPGLFTDHGAALDLTDTLGLAGRIAVNAAVDPDAGGALWRLRDGIGAASEGDGGDASLLGAMADALSTGQLVSSGSFAGETRSASGLAAEYLSQVSQARLAEDDSVAFSSARQSALSIAFAADGVDTDVEMQTLLQVEQAYAANAKMIAALDEMLQQLLGI